MSITNDVTNIANNTINIAVGITSRAEDIITISGNVLSRVYSNCSIRNTDDNTSLVDDILSMYGDVRRL